MKDSTYQRGFRQGLKKAQEIIEKMLSTVSASEEDAETVDTSAFQSVNNNNEQQNTTTTTTQQTTTTNGQFTKDDVDNMDDSQILSTALSKNQTTLDTGAKDEITKRTQSILQRNQTGTLTDAERNNIINSIINLQNQK